MNEKHIYDMIIIGGGPAGMSAAVEAYNNGIRDILILERDKQLGGILQQCIHNGFGLHKFGEELTGPEYASKSSVILSWMPGMICWLKSATIAVISREPRITAMMTLTPSET